MDRVTDRQTDGQKLSRPVASLQVVADHFI